MAALAHYNFVSSLALEGWQDGSTGTLQLSVEPYLGGVAGWQ